MQIGMRSSVNYHQDDLHQAFILVFFKIDCCIALICPIAVFFTKNDRNEHL